MSVTSVTTINRSNYINTPKDKDIIDVTRTKNDDDLDKLFEDLNKL